MFSMVERLGLMDLNELTVVIRLLLAVACAGVLGLERTRKRRPAGLRTYMLVCIGATVVMMIAQFMTVYYPGSDPGRMPAQVISGIGFLGAGTIMVTRYYRVKGLTTAAGLWVAACMGLAIGIGFYFGALVTCLILIFIMVFADRFESFYTKKLHRLHLFIIFSGIEDLKPFVTSMREKGMRLGDLETAKSDGKMGIGLFCLMKFPTAMTHDDVLKIVEGFDGILFVEEIDE